MMLVRLLRFNLSYFSGTMPLIGDIGGHGVRMTNSNQSSMLNQTEQNHQNQGNICNNMNPDLHTNHGTKIPKFKAPVMPFREQDHYMPIANLVRIIRQVLPSNAKVADGAKVMLQECVSEFISFITSEANEKCQQEHRKTITAEDVIVAMSRLGLDHYVELLYIYLQKYRENELYPPVPRSGFENIAFATNGLPSFVGVHPQSAMFSTSSGTDCGPISTSQGLYTYPVGDSIGPSLALGIGEASESEGVGPSEPPHTDQYFCSPCGHYK
ncbi:nuclear transcription factor Y subunit B-10-like [Chenopodium quinoa]|uniref:nuclear transcription factor Y subunit B-10-like n=1 Tax=Chenopodium quinoa TaxID=63459 RepID=UPI000B77D415|nr:nuclear transcription factor Y subunit B-10-like [Chenopodium quinoa]